MTHNPKSTQRLAKAMTVAAWAVLLACVAVAAGGALEVYPTVILITQRSGNDGGDVSMAVVASVAFVGGLLGVGVSTHLMLRGLAELLLGGSGPDQHARG
jgi:hypothetical protein